MKAGNCSQQVTKWFYDKKSKYCRQFDFTGCNGNENRFETREQCTELCENSKRREICNSNKIQGPCMEFQNKWYLDTETKTCKEFKYGGCLGNQNNFASKVECRNFCWEYLSNEAKSSITNDSSDGSLLPIVDFELNDNKMDCLLPKDEGSSCNKNKTENWYYDQSIAACQKFNFKGCAGNKNRFNTRQQCETKCSSGESFMLDTSSLISNFIFIFERIQTSNIL